MTTPYQQQHAPGVGYTSPIPIRRAHLGDAIASEWTKIRSVRSTIWTLGVMALLLIGIGLAIAAAISGSDTDVDGQPILSLGFFGVLLSSICVMTLGVLTIASEYGTGMIRTTLTACPSRGRVLTAKAIVFFALVFTVTLAFTLLVGAAQVAIIDQGSPSSEEWLRSTLGVSLYLALLGLLSLAVGSLIRHSAGAITIMIGLVLLPLVMAMFMFTESLSWLQDALLEYSIPSQLGVLYDNSVTESGPTGWEPLWIMLGVAAVALGSAYATMNARDV
ncbi:ABC transporter permease subunit [Streptomyces sp. NPDC056500]|uniref:ABC transporter permease subunit n=1 Tax=Streptomyces sp. NPDC056500 TaxID=3345840 RepID=UPI0036C1EC58